MPSIWRARRGCRTSLRREDEHVARRSVRLPGLLEPLGPTKAGEGESPSGCQGQNRLEGVATGYGELGAALTVRSV